MKGFISSLFPIHLFCFEVRFLGVFIKKWRFSCIFVLAYSTILLFKVQFLGGLNSKRVILIRYLQVWRKQDNTWIIFIYNSTTTTVTLALDNGSRTLWTNGWLLQNGWSRGDHLYLLVSLRTPKEQVERNFTGHLESCVACIRYEESCLSSFYSWPRLLKERITLSSGKAYSVDKIAIHWMITSSCTKRG